MDYALAKQLKDAGFPHTWDRWGAFKLGVGYPTLSELIEACGDDFRALIYGESADFPGKKWCAQATNAQMCFDTPETAVANLWLALNKK